MVKLVVERNCVKSNGKIFISYEFKVITDDKSLERLLLKKLDKLLRELCITSFSIGGYHNGFVNKVDYMIDLGKYENNNQIKEIIKEKHRIILKNMVVIQNELKKVLKEYDELKRWIWWEWSKEYEL